MRVSIQEANRYGLRLHRRVVAGFKKHGLDAPYMAMIEEELEGWGDVLLRAMIQAHVMGRARAYKNQKRHSHRNRIAAAINLKTLADELDLTEDAIRSVAAVYAPQIEIVKSELGGMVHEKVETAAYEAMKAGAHAREGARAVGEAMRKAGIDPQNSFTTEAIYRTQSKLSYGAGRWQENQADYVQEILWGYVYVTAGDDRVRAEHYALDGTRAPKDDPIWDRIWPPNGWACRCDVVEIFVDDPAEERQTEMWDEREVDGKMVVPGPDKGFAYNPGVVFKPVVPPTGIPKTPKVVVPKVKPKAVPKAKPLPVEKEGFRLAKLNEGQAEAIKVHGEKIKITKTGKVSDKSSAEFKKGLKDAFSKSDNAIVREKGMKAHGRIMHDWILDSDSQGGCIMRSMSRSHTTWNGESGIGYADRNQAKLTKVANFEKREIKKYAARWGVDEATMREVLSIDHQLTQEVLKKVGPAGSDSITLYRGVSKEYAQMQGVEMKVGVKAPVELNSLTSWSTDKQVASGFAGDGGHLMRIEIPKTDVFSTSLSLKNTLEQEYILNGGEHTVSIVQKASKPAGKTWGDYLKGKGLFSMGTFSQKATLTEEDLRLMKKTRDEQGIYIVLDTIDSNWLHEKGRADGNKE